MSKQEKLNIEPTPTIEVVEEKEITRRKELREILIRMGKEADRKAAPILAATESRLNELEVEEALLSGTLFSDSDDESIN